MMLARVPAVVSLCAVVLVGVGCGEGRGGDARLRAGEDGDAGVFVEGLEGGGCVGCLRLVGVQEPGDDVLLGG